MKAKILLLILLTAWAQGVMAVSIGNGLSVGLKGDVYFSPPRSDISVGANGGIYISPPGSHVSIPIDPPARRSGRNNNVAPGNFNYEQYRQWTQPRTVPQIMPSVPSAPSVGKVHEIHRKECLMTSYRTDQHVRKYQIIPGCKPKKTAFYQTVAADAQGKGSRLRDLLMYYDR